MVAVAPAADGTLECFLVYPVFDMSVVCGMQTMNPTACWMPLVDLVVILLGWGCYPMDGIDLDGSCCVQQGLLLFNAAGLIEWNRSCSC